MISDELNHAPSLTEFVSVRQKDTATKITTWKIWKHSFRLQMQQEQESTDRYRRCIFNGWNHL